MLAYYFGLHPWDVDRLTYEEFELFVSQAQHIMKSAGG